MVVSTDRNSINEINTWPEEVEANLIELQPGEIVKVRLNPVLWFNVLEQRGTSSDYNRPTSSGMVKKIGQHGIPSPWTIRYNRQPFQIGFLEGYDAQGVARYSKPLFSDQGELTFNGDRVGDRERFFVIQLHPQMKTDPLTGLERRNWKFEIVDAEKESTGITENFEAKLALLNKIKDLNEQSLNTLMKSSVYGRVFFHKPDLIGKTKASRAVLVKKVEEGRLKDVNEMLKNLEEVNKIGLVYDALVAKKLICTETKLLRYDGLEICTFAEEISIPNMEEAAINIFKYASHLPVFEEKVIEFLRESYEGAKSTAHKARRGVKGEE
jgi:hypothetical protein